MEIHKIDKKVPSTDGVHTLSGVVYIPDGEIKGLFQVVHGMQEYIGRYDRFMRDIASDGYIVFGHDHLGHGKTAADDSELGFIAHENGWQYLADDVNYFANVIRREYGKDLPYILFGHSMGSFVVRLTAEKYDDYDKLIVMGTGGPNPAAGAGLAVIKLIKATSGERHVSDTVEKLAFGSYNNRFEGETAHDWLSVNRENIKKYEADKYCTFRFTVSAMQDLVTMNISCNSKRWFSMINKEKPVLLVSGSDDPVGDYGKGVKTVCERLKENGANVTMKLYDGLRHEILNEDSYGDVLKDILTFIH